MKRGDLAHIARLPGFPRSGRELVAVLGLEAAAALIRAWPGLEFPVPSVVGGGNPAGERRWAQLSEIVGEACAARIVRHWGGDRLYVPTCKEAFAQSARDTARHEYDRLTGPRGYSHDEAVCEIALGLKITSRAVERWLSRPDHGAGENVQMVLL